MNRNYDLSSAPRRASLLSKSWRTILLVLALQLNQALGQQPGTIRWKIRLGPSQDLVSWSTISTPAIAPDGTIYVGNGAGPAGGTNLYSISPQGTTNWVFNVRGDIRSSPSIAADGTIYVGSFDGNLYAVSPTGNTNWVFRTGGQIRASPAVGADGTIFINAFCKA